MCMFVFLPPLPPSPPLPSLLLSIQAEVATPPSPFYIQEEGRCGYLPSFSYEGADVTTLPSMLVSENKQAEVVTLLLAVPPSFFQERQRWPPFPSLKRFRGCHLFPAYLKRSRGGHPFPLSLKRSKGGHPSLFPLRETEVAILHSICVF